MAGQLHNSLAEMVVMIGVDDRAGLVPAASQPLQDVIHEDPLYSTAFEPQVLAAISSNIALFPCSNPQQDDNYPPKNKQSVSRAARMRTWATLGRGKEVQGHGRSVTRNRSFRVSDFAQKRSGGETLMMAPAELPLGMDILNSLVDLCFPDSAFAEKVEEPSTVHHLVLTDMTGTRNYATCLTYYRAYYLTKENSWVGASCQSNSVMNDRHGAAHQKTCYIPTCLVLISKHSYFTVARDCLSSLAKKLKENFDHWNHVMKEFALQLTLTPVPPAGQLCLTTQLLQDVVIHLPAPLYPNQPVDDFDLALPFRHLIVDQIVVVMTSLLSQQRVVFVSAHYASIVIATECFLHYILPFKWNFPYVPVLPWNLVDMIDAPGTFIMGCHSKHRGALAQVGGLVVVDLDLGEVQACSSLAIPSMPQGAVQLLKLAWKKMRRQCQWDACGSPAMFTYEDQHIQELERRQKLNSAVKLACLELMSNLFRDVLAHTKSEKRFFHREQFMQNVDELDKAFYAQVLQTDMFAEFLREILSPSSPNYWVEFAERTKPYHRNSLTPNVLEHLQRNMPLCVARSASTSALTEKVVSSLQEDVPPPGAILRLPNYVYALSPAYLDKCLEELTKAVKTAQAASLRASFLYLRGMVMAALNRPVEAVQDFHKLESCDSRLFPTEFVAELLAKMPTEEREMLVNLPFFVRSTLFQEAVTQQHVGRRDKPVIMELNKIPETDIDEEGFTQLLQIFNVTSDHDSITRLFMALTLGRSKVVDPLTFEEFYKCWKENELHLQQANIPDTLLDGNDWLLKMSDVIKCSFGTGRLALTQKKLLFMQEGSKKCREVIALRNIKSVEKVQQRSLFSPVQALKILSTDEKVKAFTAITKEVTELWYLIIKEMWSGKTMSEELRDPSTVQQASQNVLLVCAYCCSAEAHYCTHCGHELEMAGTLCYFKRRKEEGGANLPPETKDVLQHRLDPNTNEAERVAVETLLYTPGKRVGSNQDDCGPRLWCGMANGKIQIYDASTWRLEPQSVLASNRVVCLVSVSDHSQVWAGSFDSKIYIIDTRTRSCKQVLTAHVDMLADFAWAPEDSLYSASLDGCIVRWDVASLQKTAEFQLENADVRSMQFHNQLLWCCTKEVLLGLTAEGSTLHSIKHQSEFTSPAQLDCFLLTPNNEIWLGCGKLGEIAIYFGDTHEYKQTVKVPSPGISKMMQIHNRVWVGGKDGSLHICDMASYTTEKTLAAHTDTIRSMCAAVDRYVLSGAGSKDGKIAIWKV